MFGRKADTETNSVVETFDEKPTMQIEEGEAKVSQSAYTPGTAAERALVRKIDLRLLPMLWGCYIFNYLDRTNIGNAKIAGMTKDLKMDDQDYNWALSIFFFGYLLMEIPSNMVLSRVRPSQFLPAIMIVWGTLCTLVTVIHNYHGLLAMRFILGCIEAGFFPGVLFLMSSWYKKSELSRRYAFFYSAAIMSGAFGGLLAGAITKHLDGKQGIAGWRWLFLIEGVATVVVSLIAWTVLPDFPATEKSFTPEERELAVSRLEHDGIGSESGLKAVKTTHGQAFKLSVSDWRTWVFVVMFIMDVGAGTISYFIPTLTKTLGYKDQATAQYMTIPIYIVATVFAIGGAFSADYFKDRHAHVTTALAVAFVSSVVAAIVQHSTVRYVMICFMASGIWTALPLILTWTSNTISMPAEKRAIVLALVNALGNLASVYGSRIWPSADAPKYTIGFGVTAGFVGFGCIVAFLAGFAFKKWPYKVRVQNADGSWEELEAAEFERRQNL